MCHWCPNRRCPPKRTSREPGLQKWLIYVPPWLLRLFGDHSGSSYTRPGSQIADAAIHRQNLSWLKCFLGPMAWVQMDATAYWWLVGASKKLHSQSGIV